MWDHEAQIGQEEGRKDRPCVIALAVKRQQDGETLVTVLPVTHRPPEDTAVAVEIPGAVKPLLGLDAATNPLEVKRQIGVVPEGLALFGRLTASEYLHFVGRMYGLDAPTTAARTEELLDFMSLAHETKKLITDFSHGMQKKLALAAAVIHGPKILFLDEPFEGVDAIASGTLKTMLQGMIARGATIFLTSHVLEIVERLCSHIAIIDRGHLIANGSLEELRAGVHADRSQFFTDLSAPFYGANRPGNKVSDGLRHSFWLQGMMCGFPAAYYCIEAFSETDTTEDLKKFDVPTLILHGDDDQIVPIVAAGMLSSKIVKGAQFKIYPGAPHGMCSTLKDEINADLLAFIKQ